MRDPVERMMQFVKDQRQQAVFEHARSIWSRKLPTLLPCIRAVVEAFQSGLEEPAGHSVVSILADPPRGEFPLVIAFGRRSYEREGILSMRPAASEHEVGASCLFRCEADGIVYGYRYPFHSVLRDVRSERFVDLGEPDAINAQALGNAVADFLEWASVGDGCGRRKLRFWAPSEQVAAPRQPVELRVVAA